MAEANMLSDVQSKQTFVEIIENGEFLIDDIPAKPRVPLERIRSTLAKIYKGKEVSVIPGHNVLIGGQKYHYYAQYNSGKMQQPWYGITQNVYDELGNQEYEGIVLLYFKTENQNINGTISGRYWNVIKSQDQLEKFSQKDEENNRFLLSFNYSENCNQFEIEKGKEKFILKDWSELSSK